MKTRFLFPAMALCSLPLTAEAAGVYYSFDTVADGTGNFTTASTAEVGIMGTSTFTRNGSVVSIDSNGGWTSTAAQNISGNEWIGDGGTQEPGHSAAINPGSAGNSYSLTLPTTTLSQMFVSFDYRYAGAPANPAFTSFTYSVNGGTAQAVPGADLSLSASSPSSRFNQWSMDLSGLTAIENQGSVTLTWNLPNFGDGQSFRMDNLQLVAVPEPSAAFLSTVAAVMLAGFRGRKK